MKTITIYDIETEEIERIAEEHQTTEAEIVEALFTALEKNDIDINDYL